MNVQSGSQVLILWGSAVPQETLENTVDELKKQTGPTGKVMLENVERLSVGSLSPSTFDFVLSGVMFPHTIRHTVELLGEIVKLVKPGGSVTIREVTGANGTNLNTPEKLQSLLKLAGLTSIQNVTAIALPEEKVQALKEQLKTSEKINVTELQCKKPNFEVGSSSLLSFAKKETKPSDQVMAVWKLDDTMDDDIETIDENELLDEEDLKKPDPASLRGGFVCLLTSDSQNMVLALVESVPKNPLTGTPREEVIDWIGIDKSLPVAEEPSDEQIIQSVVNSQEAQIREMESDKGGAMVDEVKVSWEQTSDALHTFIKLPTPTKVTTLQNS